MVIKYPSVYILFTLPPSGQKKCADLNAAFGLTMQTTWMNLSQRLDHSGVLVGHESQASSSNPVPVMSSLYLKKPASEDWY